MGRSNGADRQDRIQGDWECRGGDEDDGDDGDDDARCSPSTKTGETKQETQRGRLQSCGGAGRLQAAWLADSLALASSSGLSSRRTLLCPGSCGSVLPRTPCPAWHAVVAPVYPFLNVFSCSSLSHPLPLIPRRLRVSRVQESKSPSSMFIYDPGTEHAGVRHASQQQPLPSALARVATRAIRRPVLNPIWTVALMAAGGSSMAAAASAVYPSQGAPERLGA